mgnify:CR=1 FL=1
MFGWIRQKKDNRDFKSAIHLTTPENIILPNIFLLETNKIYNQGELGSCTSNMGCLMSLYETREKNIKTKFDPSRLFLYYNTRVLMGTIGGVTQQGGTKLFEMLRDDFKGNTQEELAKNQVLAEQFNTLIKEDAPKAFQEYLNSVNTNSIGGTVSGKIKSTIASENLSQAQNIAAQQNDQFNYQNLKQHTIIFRALEGIHAVVVGIIDRKSVV